ncbi:MAG: RDD family protein [Gammaproteobacteria bacterium]|nr:RDD family protein [Gammaproteobacteria bacterium]
MSNTTTALLRIPAFIIDFVVIVLTFAFLFRGILSIQLNVYIFYFFCLPLSFFIYWTLNINLGKKLFKLEVVDAEKKTSPTVYQNFKRCLLMSLFLPVNAFLLIPMFVSKKNQAFHDMLASTVVIKKLEP